MKKLLSLILAVTAFNAMAQLFTPTLVVSTPSYVVNRYAPVTQNIAAGSTTFAVAPAYGFGLCPGDLVMIYQAQGALIDTTNTSAYGNILSYNSAGLYEFRYVQGTFGNVVTVQTAFTNSYAASGKLQAIRVGQFSSLTINFGASIVPKPWKDTVVGGNNYRFGGLVVINSGVIANNGLISATGQGFRGGQINPSTITNFGTTRYVSGASINGEEKGEGIFGYVTDYDNFGGRFCRGAAANGGGGGDSHNAGGGGGANGNNSNPYSGAGVMVVNANNLLSAWALDPEYIANSNALTNSSGGGRGGYSYGAGNTGGNPTLNGPGSAIWGGDNRRQVGGRGGRPLTNINAETRIYFGGGGGAGESNDGSGTPGSNGGGIVYIITSTLTGNGFIESNGNAVGNTSGCNCDGSGGGGAGGSIVIKASSIASTQNISAFGGDGGNQLIPPVNESESGGGGGGGGIVAFAAPASAPSVAGGFNGTTLASFLTSMNSNGATRGATGQTLSVSNNFISFIPIPSTFTVSANSPLCAGSTLSLTTNAAGPYFWSGPNNFTATVQSPTISLAQVFQSGFYYFSNAGFGIGCTVAGTSVIVGQTPSISILNVSGSQSITCITPSVDLQAASNYLFPLTYFWSSTSFTSSAQAVNVTSAATLITLTVKDPVTNCANSATTSIRVNTVVPVTNVTPVNQSIICGPGVVATATGTAISPTINVSQCWFAPGLPAPSCSGGATSIYNPPFGTSTLVVTNLINGCSTSKTVQVVSGAGNFPTYTAITSNMTSNTFTLGCNTRSLITDVTMVGGTTPGGTAISYTLLPPTYTATNYGTGNAATYSVNTPGAYVFIIRDNNSLCETRVPLSITQNTQAPDISAEASITRTLSCFVPSVSLIGSSASSFVSYVWKSQVTIPPTVQNSSFTVRTTTAGASVNSATVIDTFTLTVTDNVNTCTSNTIVTIYQNTRPPKAAISLSKPALTCSVYSVNLTNISTSGVLPGTFFTPLGIGGLLWEGPPPEKTISNSSSFLAFTPGNYTLTAIDLNSGCTSMTTALLVDSRIYPVITSNSLAILDCGADISGTKLLASVSTSSIDIAWDTPPFAKTDLIPGKETLTLTTNSVGDYTLTVTTKSNSCVSATYFKVINGVLNADFTADQTSGYAPLTVNFTNNSASSSTTSATSSITSVWSFGNGTTRTTTSNIPTSALFSQAGTYSVTLFTAKGSCSDTVIKVIRIDIPSKLEVPNVFTPNGDNSNDIFFLKTANLSEITALIYDRWGNKIYELTTDKGNIAWDGKTQTGNEAPDGTYFYIITAKGKDGQDYNTKGSVSLYR